VKAVPWLRFTICPRRTGAYVPFSSGRVRSCAISGCDGDDFVS
jgi:hypothetical protein